MPTGTYNWNEIFAVSTKYLDDKITEAFSLTSPLMDQVMKNKKYVDGGNRLAFAIDYNPAQNIGFITGTFIKLYICKNMSNVINFSRINNSIFFYVFFSN
jgi:hypothetical protein